MTEQTQPTDAEIEALGHRMCWRYKHDTGVNHISTFTFNAQTLHDFASAIEAEVSKDYDALIRQMLEALEWEAGSWKTDPERTKSAITAARARLLDSDLSKLTERGAKAWAGVDPQKLREGGAL